NGSARPFWVSARKSRRSSFSARTATSPTSRSPRCTTAPWVPSRPRCAAPCRNSARCSPNLFSPRPAGERVGGEGKARAPPPPRLPRGERGARRLAALRQETIMESCGHRQELLLDYLYDLLETTERHALEEHLAQCRACQDALEKARRQQVLL